MKDYEIIHCMERATNRHDGKPTYFGVYNRRKNKFVGISTIYEDQEIIELEAPNHWSRFPAEMKEDLVNVLLPILLEDTSEHEKKVSDLNNLIRKNSNTNTIESIKLVQGYLAELEELLTTKKENTIKPIIPKDLILNSIDFIPLYIDYIDKQFGFKATCDTKAYNRPIFITIELTIDQITLLVPYLKDFPKYKINDEDGKLTLSLETHQTQGDKELVRNKEKIENTFELLSKIKGII